MLKSMRRWASLGCLVMAATASTVSAQDVVSYDDPLEGINRVSFTINETLDKFILRPVAVGYDYITPAPVQGAVANFFKNLGEIRNATNSLLQLEFREATVTTGRFLVNSTAGVLGLFDVSSKWGVERQYKDFGMTLARWYVPSGPYLVLPLLGPATVRSTVGLIPDISLDPMTYVTPRSDKNLLQAGNLVNIRTQLLPQEDLIVGDKYIFLRNAYLQRRAYIITGEKPEDDF